MAISTRPPRTLSDIKTHSGRVRQEHQTYRDYFQVGALELERWRRSKEREAASARVATINARIVDIDREKEILLVAAAKANVAIAGVHKQTESAFEVKKSSGLRIKY